MCHRTKILCYCLLCFPCCMFCFIPVIHLFCNWKFVPFIYLFSFWTIIALQCCISFCCSMKRISYMYAYIHCFAGSSAYKESAWVRKIPWRRDRLPCPAFLLGEYHGQRSVEGYSPWGRKESDTTEWLGTARHANSPSLLDLHSIAPFPPSILHPHHHLTHLGNHRAPNRVPCVE